MRDNFNKRADKVLQLIKDAGFFYNAIGVFGSYAREQYKTDSDIDFCVIVPTRPARNITGPLRDDADILIDNDIRRFINFEFSNQYMLFLRNCDGLNVSDKSFKVSENIEGETL